MQVRYDRSTGKLRVSHESDDLLKCRMKIAGLDVDAVEREYSETYDKLRRSCVGCRDRQPCAYDLKRDPSNVAWEAYCPNAQLLNALGALTEVVY